jgi:plasmid maintenance system antidote protein VapI
MRFDAWIRRAGISRREMARRLDTSPGHITDLCVGRSWPKLETILRIKAVTNGEVMPNDFLPDAR